MKGKLYIRFNVEFPDSGSLTPQQCEETIMHDVNMEEEKRHKQQQHQQQEAYDEDEEPSTSWVQCTNIKPFITVSLSSWILQRWVSIDL